MKRACVVCCLLLTTTLFAADGGAGELSLDRRAVATLIGHGMPPTIDVRLGGLGALTARLGPPRELTFHDGAIEAILPVAVVDPAVSFDLDVRFAPDVDRERGIVRLLPERIAPIGSALPGLDLRSLVPPVELPRTVGGRFAAPAGGNVELSAYVQRVRVLPERLVIDFGLVARAAE